MATIQVKTADLLVGDVIRFADQSDTVVDLAPYGNPDSPIYRVRVDRSFAGITSTPTWFYAGVNAIHSVDRDLLLERSGWVDECMAKQVDQ